MKPGSVIVDLAAERGGNCEATKPGQIAIHGDVSIVGFTNVPGRIAASASALYSRNLLTFLETLIDTESKKLNIDWEDELVQATLLTREGKIVHENLVSAAPVKKSAKKPVARKAIKKPATKKPVAKKSTSGKTTGGK